MDFERDLELPTDKQTTQQFRYGQNRGAENCSESTKQKQTCPPFGYYQVEELPNRPNSIALSPEIPGAGINVESTVDKSRKQPHGFDPEMEVHVESSLASAITALKKQPLDYNLKLRTEDNLQLCLSNDSTESSSSLSAKMADKQETKKVEILKAKIPSFCEICMKFVTHPGRHRRVHTGDKPHQCTECDKSFSVKSSLTSHMRIHTKERPFVCTVCNKSFADKQAMQRHMRVHTGEKPYVCKICSKSFAEYSTHARHMRIHTGEKSHVCEICNKAFSNRYNMNDHKLIHTTGETWTCDICNKSFVHELLMKRHMKQHMRCEEKSFTCGICSKSFGREPTLMDHIRTHTGERNFICLVCGWAFLKKSNLKRHMVKKHADAEDQQVLRKSVDDTGSSLDAESEDHSLDAEPVALLKKAESCGAGHHVASEETDKSLDAEPLNLMTEDSSPDVSEPIDLMKSNKQLVSKTLVKNDQLFDAQPSDLMKSNSLIGSVSVTSV